MTEQPPREVTFISSAMPPGGSLRIARTTSDGVNSEITYLTDSPHNDYKPVISPDGSKILFFRTYQEDPSFFNWKSSICVMNIDGSDFHELTTHEHMNTEPYWTRDGSDRVTWSRMVHPDLGPQGTYAFRSAWDAVPGDEENISVTNREWLNSSLRDGRLFVKQGNAYFLMTPKPDGKSTYEEISYPDTFHYLHKLSISNDETVIAYMKHVDKNTNEYLGAEIIYADFDASIPAITNERAFSPLDDSKFSWYVSISPDNQHLIFAEDGKMMEFEVASETTRQLSTRDEVQYRYPVYVGSIK
jgi:hypothetical protein